MSDVSQGPGWWQASDGRWYPPEQAPRPQPPPGAPVAPYEPGGYGQPGAAGWGTPYRPVRSTEGMAVASLVVACLAIPVGCFCGIGFLASPVAVALGYSARRRIAESRGALEGDGLAIAGMVVGGIGTALIVAGVAFILFAGGMSVFTTPNP